LADREDAFNMFAEPVIEEYTTHDLRGTLVSPHVFVLTYSIARRLDVAVHSPAALFTSCSIWAKAQQDLVEDPIARNSRGASGALILP
jgi:hypothetical protein